MPKDKLQLRNGNTQHRDLRPFEARRAARDLLRTFILQRADYSVPAEYHAEAAEKQEP